MSADSHGYIIRPHTIILFVSRRLDRFPQMNDLRVKINSYVFYVTMWLICRWILTHDVFCVRCELSYIPSRIKQGGYTAAKRDCFTASARQ